jgi:hypothetical protein
VTNAYDTDHDNQIAYLLKLAGRRAAPSPQRIERARQAARAEWVRQRAIDRWRRGLMLVGMAAGITLIGGISVWRWSAPPVDRPEVAIVQRIAGTVRIAAADRRQAAAADGAPGDRIRAGDRIVVAPDSRAAFEFSGSSVRLGAMTEVVFDVGRVSLSRGLIYVDADPARNARQLVVDTPFGRVSHSSTQFELRLDERSLGVRVREGEVTVESRQGRVTAGVGDALRVSSERPVERTRVSTSGVEWAWVTAMAAPFALEGATVPAFLNWASREQGWRWEYASPSARRLAERAVLHGSIEGLTPEDALLAVLPASGLTASRQGDQLIVAVQGER